MAQFNNPFLEGVKNEQQNRLMKALQGYEGTKYFGGRPTGEMASNLKNVLGIDLPLEELGPGEVGPPQLRNIPGMVDIKAAQAAGQAGSLTTDKLRAYLLRKQIEGNLNEQETAVLGKLNTNRAPYYSQFLNPDQQVPWAGVASGLTPDANTTARMEQKLELFNKGMEFKNRALAKLDEDRDAQRINDQQYRLQRLQIDRIHRATMGETLQAIIAGEDPQAFDYESLYNVNFESPEDQMMGIVMKAKQIENPEARKEFLKQHLSGYAGKIMQLINEPGE